MSPASIAGEAVTTKRPRTRQLDTGLEANAWSNSSPPKPLPRFFFTIFVWPAGDPRVPSAVKTAGIWIRCCAHVAHCTALSGYVGVAAEFDLIN
jgi:hypothetical protein